ncbi:transmembrane protein 82-like [Lampris incognitus]|uniref:transmembrane protein 82-like n=1 Tax=Lampris incognitus TaxID=2546036 RepID=UPI0024B53688|nr:transmembrane protein 82-like [Lampris incognitus]
MFLPFSWILETFTRLPFHSSPVDCVCQGLVGACGLSVLGNLMRIHLFIQTCRDSGNDNERKQRSSSAGLLQERHWRTGLQFWCLTALLSLVGSRVSSLIVLEFSLRAVFAWVTAGPEALGRVPQLRLIQCQFSLGCALTCTLNFLQQGASHSTFSLLLAAGLSWVLAGICHHFWGHVVRLYPLHSTERYCGKCILLLTSRHTLLSSLQKTVVLAFAIASVASTAIVHEQFLSEKDALKFWTPLTLCYAMLVVYMEGEKHHQTAGEAVLHSAVVRLGALLVLMLTAGHWTDVLHVLISLLGEAVCLLPSQDLLQALPMEEDDVDLDRCEEDMRSGHKKGTQSCTSPSHSTETEH